MIEKLDYGWQAGGDYAEPAREIVYDKINELVDAINLLQCKNVHIESNLQDLMYPKEIKCEPAENATNSKMENVAENRECSKTEQDPYKWIGKLCRFRHCDDTKWEYGILKDVIYDTSSCLVDIRYKMGGVEFRECGPVKPDDDIVYKGE